MYTHSRVSAIDILNMETVDTTPSEPSVTKKTPVLPRLIGCLCNNKL